MRNQIEKIAEKLSMRYFNPSFLLRAVRSVLVSRKVTKSKNKIPIRLSNAFQKVYISIDPSAKFLCNGILLFDSWLGGKETVSITLCENSELIIDGDFVLGSGTRIFVDSGASLYIGGKKNESASGITEKSSIMVRKKIHIGFDCIIAWNVFITDCDWHMIVGKSVQEDVIIGDHVWIAGNTSILKGSKIEKNCIVGAHSLITKKLIPAGSLVAGNPARVIEKNVQWHRSMHGYDESL